METSRLSVGWEKGKVAANGYSVSSWNDDDILKLELMVAQIRLCAGTSALVYFNWAYFCSAWINPKGFIKRTWGNELEFEGFFFFFSMCLTSCLFAPHKPRHSMLSTCLILVWFRCITYAALHPEPKRQSQAISFHLQFSSLPLLVQFHHAKILF